MCVLAFAWAAHPRWQFVLVGHRDEFHARPAAPLDRWTDRPGVIAGRDLQSGGSWLGVSAKGRIAVVTNRHDPAGPSPDKASRGALVADWLAGNGAYANLAVDALDDFNAFNLIIATFDRAEFLTNRPAPERRELEPGIYGLANGGLDEDWPKTERIKSMLVDWLATGRDEPSALLAEMRADDAPQMPPERAIESPIFILNPLYGTRCITAVLLDADGKGTIVEHRFDPDGHSTGETEASFYASAR